MKCIVHKIRGGGALPARPTLWQVINGLVGGTLGIGSVAILTRMFHLPLLMAPLGATCVLLFAATDSPLAQPRSVVGGHFLASLVGLIFLKFVGATPLDMALAVGLAIALMQLTHTLHAPAGADPLVVLVAGKATWSFLIAPVLLSSVLLVMIALLVNNTGRNRRWPKYWY
jgi:CBS-domain-containing membrane protein